MDEADRLRLAVLPAGSFQELCPENVYVENGIETLGEHNWQPYEARVQLDSRTYAFKGYVFTLKCAHCGTTRKTTAVD